MSVNLGALHVQAMLLEEYKNKAIPALKNYIEWQGDPSKVYYALQLDRIFPAAIQALKHLLGSPLVIKYMQARPIRLIVEDLNSTNDPDQDNPNKITDEAMQAVVRLIDNEYKTRILPSLRKTYKESRKTKQAGYDALKEAYQKFDSRCTCPYVKEYTHSQPIIEIVDEVNESSSREFDHKNKIVPSRS